jgi:hypothetical protein
LAESVDERVSGGSEEWERLELEEVEDAGARWKGNEMGGRDEADEEQLELESGLEK